MLPRIKYCQQLNMRICSFVNQKIVFCNYSFPNLPLFGNYSKDLGMLRGYVDNLFCSFNKCPDHLFAPVFFKICYYVLEVIKGSCRPNDF